MSNKPQAHLAVQKSRVKKYGSNYYLQNNSEFEIELFNPTTSIICASITVNGQIQDASLVLKPGQRFFLDRFLNVDRKFKFETYTVESGNAEVDKAIAQNGTVKVEFYREKVVPKYRPNYSDILRSQTTFGNGRLGRKTFDSGLNHQEFNYYSAPLGTDYKDSLNATFTTTSNISLDANDYVDYNNLTNINSTIKEKETGRVEEGSKSLQSFNTVNYDFEVFPMATEDFNILPYSQKPADEEVAMYCSKCGRKAKKGENFCPKCGNNLAEQRTSLDKE